MDTRALKNPYHDYDANPAMTRELFDPHGRVRAPRCGIRVQTSALLKIPRIFQLTPEFSQRLCCKIHELLSVMENGLKSADPRDCTGYTGWAGEKEIPIFLEYIPVCVLNCLQQDRYEICATTCVSGDSCLVSPRL